MIIFHHWHLTCHWHIPYYISMYTRKCWECVCVCMRWVYRLLTHKIWFSKSTVFVKLYYSMCRRFEWKCLFVSHLLWDCIMFWGCVFFRWRRWGKRLRRSTLDSVTPCRPNCHWWSWVCSGTLWPLCWAWARSSRLPLTGQLVLASPTLGTCFNPTLPGLEVYYFHSVQF